MRKKYVINLKNQPVIGYFKDRYLLLFAVLMGCLSACDGNLKLNEDVLAKKSISSLDSKKDTSKKNTTSKKVDNEAKKTEPEKEKPESKPEDENKIKEEKDKKKDEKLPEPPKPKFPPDRALLAMSPLINPTRPQDEVYLGDWRLFIFTLDDEARKSSGFLYSMTNWYGDALLEFGPDLIPIPLDVIAYNDVLPFACDDARTKDELGECRRLEIFVPPYCYDKARYIIGPLEDAVWDYYRNAALRHGEGWNTTQVDCATWLASLQALYLNDRIADELNKVSEFRPFDNEVLLETFRENQQLLVATRPPICMAEQRHDGGTMRGREPVKLPVKIGKGITPCDEEENNIEENVIVVGDNAVVRRVCDIPLTGNLTVNGASFSPMKNNKLDDKNFRGVVSSQNNTVPSLNITSFNTQLGNGRPLDSRIAKNACALTSVVQFDNTSDTEQIIKADVTGVTFTNLFGAEQARVFLTSDGDDIVSDDDYWAIFYKPSEIKCQEQVIAVELLGHREGDFRDNLVMRYNAATEDLFLGLKSDHYIEGFGHDGHQAFLSYTIHTYDGSTFEKFKDIRQQFASCYLATDPWALQFIELDASEHLGELNNVDCLKECPLEVAEYAVRSQCFSNSRANQRWQNDSAGYWSMNSIKNVTGNIIVNPGWLGPNLNVEVYVQKFDEPIFYGPRTIRTTDKVGQVMVELPGLVEGDRVLIKAEESCCEDYDLVIPCVPEFTGFAGRVSIPYVPAIIAPPPF